MARPMKEGLDYYPRKVGIFQDQKVERLIVSCGYRGYAIWDYLLDRIYDNGYYYNWLADEAKLIAFKMSDGVSEGEVREVIAVCCKCGLFDETVLTVYQVLTSRGIQRRYLNAAAERRNKEVIAEYWLLDDVESAGFIKRALNEGLSANNPSKSPNNPSKSPNNSTEERRVEESRVKGSSINTTSCAEQQAAPRTSDEKPVIGLLLNNKSEHPVFQTEIDEWTELYPAVDVMQELRAMKGWLIANDKKRKTSRGVKVFINSWLARAQDKGGKSGIGEYQKPNGTNSAVRGEFTPSTGFINSRDENDVHDA